MSYSHHKKTEWRRKIIKNLIIVMGSKCISCGYNRCMDALCFHHFDSSKKLFPLSKCRSWSESVKEAKKCVLVCRNCHGEIHDGIRTIHIENQTFNEEILSQVYNVSKN